MECQWERGLTEQPKLAARSSRSLAAESQARPNSPTLTASGAQSVCSALGCGGVDAHALADDGGSNNYRPDQWNPTAHRESVPLRRPCPEIIGRAVLSLGRDARLIFATRAVRLFSYGLISVVLVLYLAAVGVSAPEIGLLLALTLARRRGHLASG